MNRSNSNPTTTLLTKRRSLLGWLKRVTLLMSASSRQIGPDNASKGVFGVPLEMSIKYAKSSFAFVDDNGMMHTRAGAIPIVIAKCGLYVKNNGLGVKGIFRIPGSFGRVNALEYQFDQSASGYGLDLIWEGYTVHDAASVLRRYLNKLPDPVIPLKYYQKFRNVLNNNAYKDTEHRINAFQKLIQSLPSAHQHLLLYLLDTLGLFATTASETKMNILNLSVVFCPSILRHPDHNTPSQYKISQRVIEFLIEFQSYFTMLSLVSTRQKKASIFSSSNGDVPPVPLLLLPSSYPKTPSPPVSLHVANPSAPSKLSVSIKERSLSPRLRKSPLEINAQGQQQRNIDSDAASLPYSTLSTKDPNTTNNQTPSIHLATGITTFCCHILKRMIESRMAKPAAFVLCISVLLITLISIVYEAYLAITLCSFEPYIFFAGLVSYWGLLYYGGGLHPSTTAAIADSILDDVSYRPVKKLRMIIDGEMYRAAPRNHTLVYYLVVGGINKE